MPLGYHKPLYILPFDHRGSFQTGMLGWKRSLSPEQTSQIAAAKQVIYDGFKAAVAAGIAKERAGILVDEQFGAAGVPGFIGFAVGRTRFWEPLIAWREQKISR